tara:strand:+ start:584 stop:1660 length:1077 start_codon:yes stop_codon:yes gene_type:complete
MNTILYIAELNLPNKSAYTQHVLKICDAFASKNKTNLLVFSNKSNFRNIRNDYILKNTFKIISLSPTKLNSFFSRIRLAFYTKKISKNYNLIITRSPLTSFILSIFKINNILELHHELNGFTNIFYKIINFFNLDRNIKFIFLHKNLKKTFINKKNIILDDCVDVNDFKKKKYKTKFEFVYTGSLHKGKGIEIITYLAEQFPKKKFHIFGDINTLSKEYKVIINNKKNIILEGHFKYKFLPSILLKSEFLLMPYLEKVNVNSKKLEVSKYMSPLKLFDYLAAGKIIIASNLRVYSHILRNKKNSFLISPNRLNEWKKVVGILLKNKTKYNFIRKNAKLTAENYTWNKRVQKIISFNKL